MVLDTGTIKKINDFVYLKPRTVHEIAQLLNRNWRTANSYVERISKETGTLAFRTFRAGTRGALKIVYWNNIEKIHSSNAQERLFKQIETGKTKLDFSPFDIYQYIPEDKRSSFLEAQTEEDVNVKHDLAGTLKLAKRQVLFFSGNLSWANVTQGNVELIRVFEELAKRNVSLKFLTKVDIESMENVRKVSAINEIVGREVVEIRHCEQPLRAFIVDDHIAKFKEQKNMQNMSKLQKTYIFYEIYDSEWIEWLQKVFWNLFRTSIPADKRIKDLMTIRRTL